MRTYQNITDGRIAVVWIANIFFLQDLKTETSPIESKLKQNASLGKIEILYFSISRTNHNAKQRNLWKYVEYERKKEEEESDARILWSIPQSDEWFTVFFFFAPSPRHNFKIEFCNNC